MSLERAYGEAEETELAPPNRSERTSRWPIPVPATPLIGRDRHVASILDLIADPHIRLITLTGAGGIGKTRLALAVAWELDREVVFVHLAPVATPDLVASTIAQSIGLEPISNAHAFPALRDALRDGELILVLDNFEHLSQASLLVSDLLAACPELTVLVTSRSRLAISGEHVIPVDPLELPESDDLASVRSSEAVRLFIDRARAAHPSFEISDANAQAVLRICQTLDGLPLAIELAAARSNLISPQALAARLEHRLQVLTGGPGDVPARLQTMRAAIAWSVDLLNEQERSIWMRLGVFSGGFSLESVESIVASLHDDLDALVVVQSLIDQGLVRQGVNSLGEPRFSMLETTREYAIELLRKVDGEVAARETQARHILEYTEVLEEGLRSPVAGAWQERTKSEIANIRLAIGWFRDHGLIEEAMQIVSRLEWFWTIPSFIGEGRTWCDQLLERVDPRVDPVTLGNLLVTAGTLANWHQETELSESFDRRALQIWRELGDTRRQAACLLGLGNTAIDRSNFDEAEQFLHECWTLASATDDVWTTASATTLRGIVAGARGENVTSIQFHETALRLYQGAGYIAHSRSALNGIAQGYIWLGEYQRAWENYEAVLTLCEDGDLYAQVPIAIEGFAQIAVRNQQDERGVRLLGVASAQRKELGLRSRPFMEQRMAELVEDARRSIGEARFSLAWSTGQAMTRRECFAEARSVTYPTAQSVDGLTRREREVLGMLVEGSSDTEIAEVLFISTRTASKHVAAILEKLGAGNRTAAATIAHRRGLI
jgi:predicted ATPase/DNA-binding CsgD family transcriptional regulator